MYRLILILCLFLPLDLLGQNRRYEINTIDAQEAEGSITLTDQYIYIYLDSMMITLPIVDSGIHKQSIYYILEGCYKGTAFRGAGMLSASSTEKISDYHRRYYFALYIELRARQKYLSTKYSIYYDE